MIPPTTFALFVTASLALVLIPGPNHLYITARGLAQGRSAGLASALGVETGTLVHIAAAAAGLSYVISQSATLFAIVKWAGVAYLIYLGVRAFTGKQTETGAPEPQPLRKVFLEGMLVNVLNPKVALFFLAFLPHFVDPGAGSVAAQVVVFGLTLLLLGLISDIVYALTAGALGTRLKRAAKTLRYVSGIVYLGLGVATAFAGRK
ncbi:Threonine/homoserine/homoserine lactone efflux protein [Nonomuraea solani]|uniref:Threonine/homoserine/homoserine lactone efflux protein n=1 Tax=Nonomuraea solani TaxID=1144553 RepID=A0A1H6BVP4_9ACTN|nr:LysE family translocator [Nonomuraea solani]SEG64276.1 Threonine/homoserine/homoserine lactone efflux protein [Nonomuraea solani]